MEYLPTVAAAGSFNGTITGSDISTSSVASALTGIVGGVPKVVRRSADSGTVTLQATPQADDTLLWAVGATDVWLFEAYLVFTAADATGSAATSDWKIGWSVPSAGTMLYGQQGLPGNTIPGFVNTLAANSPQNLSTEGSTPSGGAAAVTFGLKFEGFYTGGGNAGTVNLKWSQQTSGSATLVLNKNSLLRLARLA